MNTILDLDWEFVALITLDVMETSGRNKINAHSCIQAGQNIL
jgi:hypothetical protein